MTEVKKLRKEAEEGQSDINELQDEAIERIRGLSAEQLQQILSTFRHAEVLEAYPDIYTTRREGVVVWSYNSQEGRYMVSDSTTFLKYEHVFPLTPKRQLCFSEVKADVFEDG